MAAPERQDPPLSNFHRITSYNVCYTKLLREKGEDDCPFQSNCPVRSKWGRVQVAMMHEMESITFEDLAQEAAGIPVAMPSFV